MSTRLIAFVFVPVIVTIACARFALAQNAAAGNDRAERLAALAPDTPMAYFELAEEIAYEAQDEDDVALARRLYVLAFELDRHQEPIELGSSACLGIRDLSTDAAERRWLEALARAMDQDPGRIDWPLDGGGGASQADAFLLAEAMGRHRAGDYRRATLGFKDALDSGVIDELPEHHVRVIQRSMNHAQDTPACRSCKRRRFINNGPDVPARLCTACKGDPGPEFDETALAEHVAVEAVLLGATPEKWSAQLLIMDGVPIRDFHPSELARVYQIDPSRSVWRDGRWIAP